MKLINLNIGDELKIKLVSIIKKGLQEKWYINIDELKIKDEIKTSGANSRIYNCEWRGIEIILKCIKKFNKKYLEDFINEIDIFSTIRHPFAVEFLGLSLDLENLEIYILMEKINGTILSSLLDNNKIKNRDKIIICKKIYSVLNFLHNCKPKIIYRDLKPDNIIVFEDNKVKLLDFGLSKFLPENGDYKLTGDTGTTRYMAPEVFLKKKYCLKVDVYSYGLILYYIYKNEKPFLGYNKEKLNKYFNKEFNYNINIRDNKIKDLIENCINFDVEKRYDINLVGKKLDELTKYNFGFFTFY